MVLLKQLVARLGVACWGDEYSLPVAFLSSFGNDKLLHEITDQQTTPPQLSVPRCIQTIASLHCVAVLFPSCSTGSECS
jgi:hypothetical protein